MTDRTTKTATINGITFRRIERECGGIICIDGRKGYVWSSLDGHEREAAWQPGVYHARYNNTTGNSVHTRLDGIDVREYRAAMGL